MLAFVHTPKTAGQSVGWMLRSSFGVRHCDVEPWRAPRPEPFLPDDLRRLRRFYPRLSSIAGHRVVPYVGLEQVSPRIKYFMMLRDPLKRCASFFQYATQKQGRDLVFEEWIKRQNDAQTRQIASTVDVDAALQVIQEKNVFIGLVERFDESLLLFKALVANDLNIAYEPRNVAADDKLGQRLLTSERTRQMLFEVNRADLELYAYVKNELYPSYRREYGPRLNEDVVRYRQNRGKLNRRNVILNRLYRNLVYKPALKLYRLKLSD